MNVPIKRRKDCMFLISSFLIFILFATVSNAETWKQTEQRLIEEVKEAVNRAEQREKEKGQDHYTVKKTHDEHIIETENQIAYTDYDKSVYSIVFENLNNEFVKKNESTVADRITFAFLSVYEKRNNLGESNDEKLRDAEYYLMGLSASVRKDVDSVIPILGIPAYNVMKIVAFQLKNYGYSGLEEYLPSNKSNPISRPGGWLWALRGLYDGLKIRGSVSTRGMIKKSCTDGGTYNVTDGFPEFSWSRLLFIPAPTCLRIK